MLYFRISITCRYFLFPALGTKPVFHSFISSTIPGMISYPLIIRIDDIKNNILIENEAFIKGSDISLLFVLEYTWVGVGIERS